jgi:hypothetical protein
MLLFLLACLPSPKLDDSACTEIGCTDGLAVNFTLTTPGAWTFDLDLDGTVAHCSATLPLDGSGGCDTAGISLNLSGSELPEDQQSITGLTLEQTGIVSLGLTISRDGTQVWTDTLTPTYETLAPNGEACGPVCSSASESVTVE